MVDGAILIVEDQPFQREILSRLCRPLTSGDVLEAGNGAEALALLDGRDELALLVSDLQMPVMDGIALMRHVAERGLKPRIILISAEQSSILHAAERVAKAYGMNLLGSVEKPVTRAALAALLVPAEATIAPAPGGYSRPDQSISTDEVRDWLAQGHLSADLQPKVDLSTGAVAGAEALARLFSPVAKARVSPGLFIPVVEADPQLTTDFTLAIAGCVAGAFAGWPQGSPPPTLSVNLPATALGDPDLADRLSDVLRDNGVAPDRIIWEVTETAALANIGTAIEILTRLRLKGSGLSIDDFGTGHSSLDRLAVIPFTEVKIDRAFVHGCVTNHQVQKILASTVELAHSLGMKCVAEGAETDDEVDLLRDLGCDIVQGYAIARPMPVDEFAAWCLHRAASAG